jgi:hypothetical protein
MDVCDSGNFRLTKNQGVSSFVVYRGIIYQINDVIMINLCIKQAFVDFHRPITKQVRFDTSFEACNP